MFHALSGDWWIFNPHSMPPDGFPNRSPSHAPRWDASLWGVHKQAAPGRPGERGLQPPKGERLPGEAPRRRDFRPRRPFVGVHKQAGFWRPDERGLHPLEGGRLLGEAADSPRGAFACNASLWAARRLHEQGLRGVED